jgi:hypothetical protein
MTLPPARIVPKCSGSGEPPARRLDGKVLQARAFDSAGADDRRIDCRPEGDRAAQRSADRGAGGGQK